MPVHFKIITLMALLGFVGSSILAQERPFMEGRILSMGNDVEGVHVLNLNAQRFTITNGAGYFTIPARLNDTLVFSAIHYVRKIVVVNQEILESRVVFVPLVEIRYQLEGVTLRPFNLSGDLGLDAHQMDAGPVVTATTLNLPNAQVPLLTQTQRKLYTARTWDFRGTSIKLDPIINAITGRTKMLKHRVKRDNRYQRTQGVRNFYQDSLLTKDLGIPGHRIADFMHYCEVDPVFQAAVDTHDRLKIWEYMRRRSTAYRQNNGLD